MKKALSLILALIIALGLSVPAFAADNATTVTATVPSMTYNIVIPSNGAAMTAENHAAGVVLGAGVTDGKTKAGVENVQYAKATDRIYYTATLSDFTDGNDHTMAATYTYAQSGDYAALTNTTKVTVFDGSKSGDAKYADSTVKVSVTDEVWNAAAAGTYTATVTFNFAVEDAPVVLATVADVLATVPGGFPIEGHGGEWQTESGIGLRIDSTNLAIGADYLIPLTTAVTKTGDNEYTFVVDDSDESMTNTITVVFTLTGGKLTEVKLTKVWGTHEPFDTYERIFHAPTT